MTEAVPVKVLVIEDDLKLAALLRKGLEASGHVVDNAHHDGDAHLPEHI